MGDQIEVAVAVILRRADRETLALVNRRSPDAHLPGLVEFPGGKVEPGESPRSAAVRELTEETGIRIAPDALQSLVTVLHDYPDRTVHLHAFVGLIGQEGRDASHESSEAQWIPAARLRLLPMPAANAAILDALESWLESARPMAQHAL